MSNYSEKRIFPNNIKEISSGLISRKERYQYQYPIIMRYLKNKIKGNNIGDFLEQIGAEKLAIYAVTEFTELVCDDLANFEGELEVVYICDKNSKKFLEGYREYQVVEIDKLVFDYQKGVIDKILICSIFHINEIFDDLLKKGIALEDMISISNVIFNMSRKGI